jgi:phosphate transport system ATP-binding protein
MAPEGVDPGITTVLPSITIVIGTHNLQQAARVSGFTAFFMVDQDQSGSIDEIGSSEQIFTNPKNQELEDFVTGRFG